MDVGMPLRSVVPTLDGPVAAVLAATTAPLSLAEVHRRTGSGSKSGIRRVLQRLVAEGLVHEVPGGYALNRDHLAAAAVEQLANLHGELIARIRGEVEAWTDPPALVGMFGSAARRDGDSSSDIDLLVVSEHRSEDEVDQLRRHVEAWTGNTAQIVTLTPADIRRLRRSKEPILAVWDRELMLISGERRALQGSR